MRRDEIKSAGPQSSESFFVRFIRISKADKKLGYFPSRVPNSLARSKRPLIAEYS